ncbi:MAG TPA: AzlC family ABC transporter permease [Caldimonas sp.]|nr:AzlC family ABC transporter permease [Caldimonas sp.]HEX4235570.1 AzlC family ABC transporter permease [Caldimonas sp.]
MKSVLRHPQFRVGALDMALVAPGIAAWGVMTGVAMVKSGMSLFEVLLMGVFVFAGSSQLAALPLIAAGAPMWVILATSVCVNLRFVVFSAHLRGYVAHLPMWRRLLCGYLFADLNYGLFTKRFPQPATNADAIAAQDAYWLGNGTTGWLVWAVSSLVGVALAATIPIAWGLGFAGILALLATMYLLATTWERIAAAAVAGAVAVAAFALPLKLNILVAIAVAIAAGLALEKAARSVSTALTREPREEHP